MRLLLSAVTRLASETPLAMDPRAYIGIDLGWSRGRTGLASVDESGRLTDFCSVLSNDEIHDWVSAVPGRAEVVAVDAPLVVPNETGQRIPERLIGHAFGAFGASAHSSNRHNLGGQPPRAQVLARRFGWTTDPNNVEPSRTHTACVEVYPHPALVGLFRLPYRLAYKKGSIQNRLPGFQTLVALLESVPELAVGSHPQWAQVTGTLQSPTKQALDQLEDELDAIVCAHLAWLWRHRPGSLQVYGNATDGYIVAPPPPTHSPRRPIVQRGEHQAEPHDARQSSADDSPRTTATATHLQAPATAVSDMIRLRRLLIDRVLRGEGPVTYTEAGAHLGRIARNLTPVLTLLEHDCARHGEPNLAVLVISRRRREPTKYAQQGMDWVAEQQRCAEFSWKVAR